MHTGILLMVAVVTACARSSVIPAVPQTNEKQQERPIPNKDYLGKYVVPKYIFPYYLGYEESPQKSRSPANNPKQDWFAKEIDRINKLALGRSFGSYEPNFPRDIQQNPFFERLYVDPKKEEELKEFEEDYDTDKTESFIKIIQQKTVRPEYMAKIKHTNSRILKNKSEGIKEEKKKFAVSPSDKEYYKHKLNSSGHNSVILKTNQVEEVKTLDIEIPRQTRQNPNLGKEKTLVASNVGKIQSGIYKMTLSSGNEEGKDSSTAESVHMLESPTADPADSIYSVAIIAALGAALAMVIFGFAIGWYTLSKKAKAAADVDYPAYGVTGPSVDMSGDRKLAHSAHMYHYQHQKQQILAMERNGLEHRNGSVSEPESEEENEEGDYTVYECPGFATTGNIEVKNPLFAEEPSPLTPGKCQVVKQQPKD